METHGHGGWPRGMATHLIAQMMSLLLELGDLSKQLSPLLSEGTNLLLETTLLTNHLKEGWG